MASMQRIQIREQNRAALFYGPQDVRVEEIPTPRPGMGEVVVRIGAALTCGTDRKTYRRGHPVIIKSMPSLFGHEMAGTVVEVGEGVSGRFESGQRVVIANSAPCGTCYYCQKNNPNLCENIVFLNGAFSRYLLVPRQIVNCNLHRIPETMPFDRAALAEPLACVLHAVQRIQVQKNDIVALIGTGPMAYLFVAVVKALGGRTIVIGRNQEKLNGLKAYGAAATICSEMANFTEEVCRLTGGYGADVAIEAVGQPELWDSALSLVRKGGRVLLYGGCARGTKFEIDTYRIHYEEISVHGIFHHTPSTFGAAVDWLASEKLDTAPFLMKRCSLEELAQVLGSSAGADVLKYVVEP